MEASKHSIFSSLEEYCTFRVQISGNLYSSDLCKCFQKYSFEFCIQAHHKVFHVYPLKYRVTHKTMQLRRLPILFITVGFETCAQHIATCLRPKFYKLIKGYFTQINISLYE
jgi:hypothetical protein